MIMAKQNYSFYADLGLHTKFIVRYLAVRGTRAGPNFVVVSGLPPQL